MSLHPLRYARSRPRRPDPDAVFVGSMGWFTLTPRSERAKRWLRRNVNDERQRRRTAVHFDGRVYFGLVYEGMRRAGLVIRRVAREPDR
jgi:hypothetical protein